MDKMTYFKRIKIFNYSIIIDTFLRMFWIHKEGVDLALYFFSLKRRNNGKNLIALKKIYEKKRLGWSYENNQILVIEYRFVFKKWYRLHSQSTKIKDIYTFKKPSKIEKKRTTYIKIGRQEFKEEYNSNRWTIPVNYELDFNLP